MNAISELKRLPETKAQKETFVNAVIGELLSGDIDPLQVELRLKIIEDTIKAIRSDVRVKSLIHEGIELYGKEGYQSEGSTIKLKTRRTNDYSNDNIWVGLKSKLKARETEIKTLGAIPETGEAIITKHSEFVEVKYK